MSWYFTCEKFPNLRLQLEDAPHDLMFHDRFGGEWLGGGDCQEWRVGLSGMVGNVV